MAFAFDQDELGSPARIKNLVYLRQFCLRCIDCRCHSRFFILLYVPPIRWKPPQQNGIQPSSSKGVIFRHKSSRTNFKQIFQRHWLPGRTITCTVCCVYAVKFVNVDSRVLPAFTNFWLSFVCFPVIGVFLCLAWYYLKTSRELKRWQSICRSPVFSHFSETIAGLDTIRTRKRERDFIDQFYR